MEQLFKKSLQLNALSHSYILHNILSIDPCIIKILLGLLGYSCKLHRKRSRNSLSFTEKGKEKDLKTSGGDEEAKNEEKEPEDKRCQTPPLGGREGSSTTTSTSETKETDGNGDVKCNLSVGVDKTGDDDIQNNCKYRW